MFWSVRERERHSTKLSEGTLDPWSESPAREQESLKRVGIIYENGARSIERECQQAARHRMPRRPDLEREAVAAAGKGRGQDSNDRFYQSTVMQTEGEY